MKMRPLLPKQKLRATATRRVAAATPREYEEEEEPSMRLSSAFIVVVLLHVVAVGGIFAFESIKVNRPTAAVEAAEPAAAPITAPASQASTKEVATVAAVAPANVAPAKPVTAKPVAAAATTKPAVQEVTKTSAPAPAALRDSGKIHVVVKGENPRAIARKLGVKYEDLLKLNKIEDPTKLQIGQKLMIPKKG